MSRWVALAVLCGSLALAAQTVVPAQRRLQDAIQLLETSGDYPGAIAVLEEVVQGQDRLAAARAWLLLGDAYEKLGRDGARQAYERLLSQEFADQPQLVAEARARLARLTAASRPATAAVPMVRPAWNHRYSVLGRPSTDGQPVPAMAWPERAFGLLNLETGRFQIVLRDPDHNRNVTDPSDPVGAALSPDGTRIAMSWEVYPASGSDHQIGELRVVGVDGSGQRTVLSDLQASFDVIGWTPDGRNIVATRWLDDGSSDVLMVAVDTGLETRLIHLAATPFRVSLSPDGKRLAYDIPPREGSASRDIAVLEVETRRQQVVVDHLANDTYPVWHPDGHRLVFVSDRTGAPGVWLLPAADSPAPGEPSLVNAELGPVEALAISSSGALYFGVWTGVVDVYVSSRDRATGRWSAPATVARKVVGNNYFSGWSPDTRWLALASRRGGHRVFERGAHVLVLHDMTTGDERELRPDVPGGISWPAWAPDGRSLMILSKGQQGLYRIDAEAGALTVLIERDSSETRFAWPAWMPDGRGIVFNYRRSVWLRTLETGEERVLYEPPPDAFPLTAMPSPDGRFLAVSDGGTRPQRSLRIVPIGGGEARTVLTVPNSEVIWVAGWTPDGSTLVVTWGKPDGDSMRSALWSVPVAGGDPRPLNITMEGLRDARLSPDGEKVAFTAGIPRHETRVLENAIPLAPASKR